MITRRLLQGLPLKRQLLAELQREGALCVPGELGPLTVKRDVTLLVCEGNGGEAWSVAQELQAAADAGTDAPGVTLRSAGEVLRGGARRRSSLSGYAVPSSSSTYFFLYLDKDIFLDGGMEDEGSIANLVRAFLDQVRTASTGSIRSSSRGLHIHM